MSNAAKTGIAIVVIIILVVIGWLVFGSKGTPTQEPSPSPTPSVSVSPSPVSQVPNTAGTGLTSASDNSTASLQTDAAAVDSQMNGLNTDSANVDSGLSSGSSIPVQQ